MLPIHASGRRTKIVVALVATVVAGVAACSSRIADVAAPLPSSAQRTPTVANAPYFEYQVEKQAQQMPGTGNLRYPDQLRQANVQGVVLAQFVVDERGAVEPGTFKALKSDHQLFSNAVELALPAMRFAAAEIGDKKVRQLVQQPFTFSLSGPSSPSKSGDGVTSRPTTDKPYVEFKLSKEARQIPGAGNLRYPDALRSANVQGEVLAQFVVDANGEVLPGSFRVVRSDHAQFTQAVVTALPAMRFYPAEVEGKKVRQMLTMPFTFSLSKQ